MVTIVGKDNSITKECTCKNCGARLQYTPSEETRDYSTDYTGSKYYYSYIVCPSCGHKVTTKWN